MKILLFIIILFFQICNVFADTDTYYFDGYDPSEAWGNSPENMVDGDLSTRAFGGYGSVETQLCNSNSSTSSFSGYIEKVELRWYGSTEGVLGGTTPCILRPVFSGTSDGDNHSTASQGGYNSPVWSSYFDITSDTNAPNVWQLNDLNDLECDVVANGGNGILTVYKVEIRVTYTKSAGSQVIKTVLT